MYIIEHTFKKHQGKSEPLVSDYERCDHDILGYFESFEDGLDFIRVFHDSTHDSMEHKDYKEEFFNYKEYSHDSKRNEIRAWKKWEHKENEDNIYFYYDELQLYYVHNLAGKDPYEAICELIY